MSVTDNGPDPNAFDIETKTVANENYRTVAWTGKYLQVTLMAIPVGESIGLETHPETDQFLRLDAGQGKCVMGPAEDQLDFEQDVSAGWSIPVPAGTWEITAFASFIVAGRRRLAVSAWIGTSIAMEWTFSPAVESGVLKSTGGTLRRSNTPRLT